MTNLKLKVMLLICRFIKDWYSLQNNNYLIRSDQRIKSILEVQEEIITKLEEF